MATTQSPIGAGAPRPAEHGLGHLAAWRCDHRRHVLASWLLARLWLKQPDLVVNLIATQILGLVMARYVVGTEPLASLSTARRRMPSLRPCNFCSVAPPTPVRPGDCRTERP
jgi:hypothetical protein